MQPFSGNQRPDLLTALMNMSLVLRRPRKMHLCRSPSNVPRLPWLFEMLQNLHVLLTFDKRCKIPWACHAKRHLNAQKWREHVVFLTFWLRNVLRATTACTFSSLIWPDGSAPAALASLLFEPLAPQIIGKTQCFATVLPFRAPASSFFWLFLFSDLLSSALLFSILLLHLCFSSVYVVGSLTSKLPSIMGNDMIYNEYCYDIWMFEHDIYIWFTPSKVASLIGTPFSLSHWMLRFESNFQTGGFSSKWL